jgi:hypothetical protein
MEDFWALKSRVGWVVEEDRHTKVFHIYTIIRRQNNKIVKLRNSVGEWIKAVTLLENIFNRALLTCFPLPIPLLSLALASTLGP